eukprot:UN30265
MDTLLKSIDLTKPQELTENSSKHSVKIESQYKRVTLEPSDVTDISKPDKKKECLNVLLKILEKIKPNKIDDNAQLMLNLNDKQRECELLKQNLNKLK